MNKKNTRALASATVLSLVLTTVATTGNVKAAKGEATRIGGQNRYETAAKVATSNWEKSDKVILASGAGYADSLSASVLSKKLDAPIILTESNELNENAKEAMKKLGAKEVYVIGGNASVSEATREGLKKDGCKLVELGGKTRFETNLAIADYLADTLKVDASNVLVVNGKDGFSDALSVAPVAAAKQQILLITSKDVKDAELASKFVAKHKSKVTVVGTENVVPKSVYDLLNASERVNGGANRFATNLNILNHFNIKGDKLYAANATGNGYADALVGSALAGKFGAPLVLTDTKNSKDTVNAVKYIKDHATKDTDLQVLGGEGVMPKEVVEAINKAVKVEALNVESVKAINSAQAEVKFNKQVKEAKPANFKVADKEGNVAFVSNVKLNADKKTAVLTFFDKFVDKGEYTVETSNVIDVDGKTMKADTDKFGYQKSEVAKVEFTSTTVKPDTDFKKSIKVTDKLGRDVSKEVEVEFETSNSKVVSEDGKATEEGTAMVVAKVKEGDAYVKTAPTTIKVTNSKAKTFAGYYAYTDSVKGNTEDFEKMESDKKINNVLMNGKNHNLAVYYKDQYGEGLGVVKEFNTEDGAKLTNLTPNVVIVNDDGTITPISVGTGYVKVTNGDISQTVKIEVKEASKAAEVTLDKSEVSLVAGSNINEVVKVSVKDQYKNELADQLKDVKVSSEDEKVASVKLENGNITIKGIKEGSTKVKVSLKTVGDKTLEKVISVKVAKGGELAKYKVEVGSDKLDLQADDPATKKVEKRNKTNINVYELDKYGNKIKAVEKDKTTLEFVDKDGKAIESEKELLNKDDSVDTVNALKTGTAYLDVKVGSLNVGRITFTINNSNSVVKTAKFDSLQSKIALPTNRNDIAIKKVLFGEKDLQAKIVKIYDQTETEVKYGLDLKEKGVTCDKISDDESLKFDYVVTNKNGLQEIKSDETNPAKLKVESSKTEGTADVVITKLYTNANTNVNLISKPLTIKVQLVNTDQVELNEKAKLIKDSYEVKSSDEVKTKIEKSINDEEITVVVAKDSVNDGKFKVTLTKGVGSVVKSNVTIAK